jgi:hypothetical protein
MFRMIALIACWSHDYWLDVNHEDPNLRDPDYGPSRYEIILVRSWRELPTTSELFAEAVFLQENYLHNADGHKELHSHALLDGGQWQSMRSAAHRAPPNDLTEQTGSNALFRHGRWRPVEVCGLLTFQEAIAMMYASGALLASSERSLLPPGAPAINYWEKVLQ